MRPVDQTKFGEPEGNCVMACIASILHRPLSETPDLSGFAKKENGPDWQDWHDAVDTYLFQFNLFHLDMKFAEGYGPAGYAMMSGPGKRGIDHCCVSYNGKLSHDPHPSRDGLIEITSWTLLLPVVKIAEGRGNGPLIVEPRGAGKIILPN